MLGDKLRQEFEGILTWLVAGCLAWQELGSLKPSNSVVEATHNYKIESDSLGEFLGQDFIRLGKAEDVDLKSLYKAYKAFAIDEDVNPMTKRSFSNALEERGFKRYTHRNNPYFRGLSLVF